MYFIKEHKSITYMVLVLFIIFIISSTAVAVSELEDIEESEYAHEIRQLMSVGIFRGFPDGTFRPGETTTRAQTAKIMTYLLNRAEEANEKDVSIEDLFHDVEPDHWAAEHIIVCVEEGIYFGFPDGTFRPSEPVTQRQLVALLLRLLHYDTVEKPLNWAIGVDEKAKAIGLIDWDYKPNSPASREILAYAAFNAIQGVKMANGTYLAQNVDRLKPLSQLQVISIE